MLYFCERISNLGHDISFPKSNREKLEGLFSSPESLAYVRRASSVVCHASSTIALNNISSETARPRALIFGM